MVKFIVYVKYLIMIFSLFGLWSCSTISKNAEAVKSFHVDKYMGLWYEIARFDFKFERGLNNTSAEYSLNEDGTIKVVNRGFDYEKKEWREATGKAKFVRDENVAMLKVSFFGPFYSGYNIIALDENYKYALVAGKSLKYLWILARETTIPDSIKNEYLMIAKEAGFQTDNLLWIEHNMK